MPIVGYGPPADWVPMVQDRFRPGEGRLLLGARVGDVTSAFANAQLRTLPGSPPQHIVYLDNAYVGEGARGHGIGEAILARVEAWAQERGLQEVQLECFVGNELGL